MKRLCISICLVFVLVQPARGGALKPFSGDPKPPPLVLSDLQGNRHDLNEYRGRVVLVNFWASWCPPCVDELPSMQRLQTRLGTRPFTILAVNMGEPREAVEQFRHRVGMVLTTLMDTDAVATKAWRVYAVPSSFVVDRDGNIRYALYGALDWDNEDVVRLLQDLFQK